MKVIIVGGVAGGATAAARIRRLDEHAEITVFESALNFHIYAICMTTIRYIAYAVYTAVYCHSVLIHHAAFSLSSLRLCSSNSCHTEQILTTGCALLFCYQHMRR